MYQRWTLLAMAIALVLALALIAFLIMRGGTQPVPAPTANFALVQTQAVAAFASALTGTAQSRPTAQASFTPAPLPEVATAASVSPTASCLRLKWLQDVTIPDYTVMTPAQVFTKTWQVENSGTCPWKPGFKMVLIGGTAMGASPFTVSTTVNPGGRLDVSMKMVATANQTGKVEGTWQMSDDTGVRFGDPLTVIIVITTGTGAPPPAVPTATP